MAQAIYHLGYNHHDIIIYAIIWSIAIDKKQHTFVVYILYVILYVREKTK